MLPVLPHPGQSQEGVSLRVVIERSRLSKSLVKSSTDDLDPISTATTRIFLSTINVVGIAVPFIALAILQKHLLLQNCFPSTRKGERLGPGIQAQPQGGLNTAILTANMAGIERAVVIHKHSPVLIAARRPKPPPTFTAA